ncbi:hypothetical protein EXU85_31890 [Spirosoma sp. KCTC 42546]|uniref:hypothetical protein n=1 Tax=Spirosoma sp. KCTC 42546 TaxID=2520506 RepID=UPI0011578B74|nr:hypothetical protein [Spirosoma sp. KCTC 42546]QDK82963.1 hypothetical protein EXU85_31890 [Spirosoma sp. KCTC 42546]
MSIQEMKSRIHHLVDETEDETRLIFFLYVANQLLAEQPDYDFLNEKTLDQLIHVSALVDAFPIGKGIDPTVLTSKIRERFTQV